MHSDSLQTANLAHGARVSAASFTCRERVPCYADGQPFRTARPRGADPREFSARSTLDLLPGEPQWAEFWAAVRTELERRGYLGPSVELYRQVLRSFYRSVGGMPSTPTDADVRAHLEALRKGGRSRAWIAMSLSALRTIFDKLGGLSITEGIQGPKRARRLPEILSREEVARLLQAAPNLRDRLLFALMYGCGIKVGEVSRLRWADFDLVDRVVTVVGSSMVPAREVAVPEPLLPLLAEGVRQCPADAYVFAGRTAGSRLRERTVALRLKAMVRAIDIAKPVCCMSLRHAYAVHALEDGANPRELQVSLGHADLDTTLRYRRCILPAGARSPLDALPARESPRPAERAAVADPPCVSGANFTRPVSPIAAADFPCDLAVLCGASVSPGPVDRLRDFRQLLTTQLGTRFLALKASFIATPVGRVGARAISTRIDSS